MSSPISSFSDPSDIKESANKLLSENTKSRAEDFCIIAGIDIDDFLPHGIEAALRVFDTFVSAIPEKFHAPKAFKRMLLKNPELVYSMIEASGSSIISKSVDLSDQIKSASSMLDHARESHFDDLRELSQGLRVERYATFSVDLSDSVDDEDDDLPSWQVTIHLPNGKKITHLMSHIEMSTYFNHSVLVDTNPHPEFDGADLTGTPLDDIDIDHQTDRPHDDWDEEETA